MKFTSPFAGLTTIIVLAAKSALSTPAPAPFVQSNASMADIQKRTPGGVFICTDINFSGTCGYAVQPLNTCIELGSDWDNKISSFGPDPCAICFAYDFQGCSEASWEFTYPGDATGGLGTSDPWNDRISAFLCEQTSC